jgi:ABC-type multidrug transport system fused ATPase/permease subunit
MDVAEGANLSGGQKQRIAIARALIKKPKLLLLDEATSSLDIATEDRIIETLWQNFKDITTIIISHRINLITDADEIIVLEKGKIVERGRHDELIENKKLYYQFYRQQVDETEPGKNIAM